MPKAAVTGHLGFIGSHLVPALESQGWDVCGYDLKNGFDIRTAIMQPADICFHLAAQTNARSKNILDDATTNIIGTLNVLEQFGRNTVFASSSAVNYPVTPYAVSKLAGEHYCKLYGARIVRLCNIYGPGSSGVHATFAQANRLQIAGSGSQKRTYAFVDQAVKALINSTEPLHILSGKDMTVNEVAAIWPRKPRDYVERSPNDIEIGTQVMAAAPTAS